jgi:TonB-dependent SusC/RagA subfamily outer membrane receptor
MIMRAVLQHLFVSRCRRPDTGTLLAATPCMRLTTRTCVLTCTVLVASACHSRTGGGRTDPDNTQTGSVVSGRALANANAGRVEELFIGRFSGVQVFRHANGGISIQIRGQTSIEGGNEPLFVVDGQPLDPAPGGALLGINPNDITRIEILKDIGSTSFYGVRGANGVVLITLKKKQS